MQLLSLIQQQDNQLLGCNSTKKVQRNLKKLQKIMLEKQSLFLDGEMISAPTVNEAITGGKAVINGTFTPEEARQLVARLNSGALPVPVTLLSTESIGPTLGVDALHAGIRAGIIGFLAIVLLLLLWYRLTWVDCNLFHWQYIQFFMLCIIQIYSGNISICRNRWIHHFSWNGS
jgi:preprotein translocase subunit SecD